MKRALFIHIPKTGGSSIAEAPFIILHGSYRHKPITTFLEMLDFSFSFVRNPYTRYASAVLNHHYCSPEDFEKWTTTTFLKDYRAHFENWAWIHLQPQIDFLYHNAQLSVDFVGKFENMEEDFQKVCDMVGVQHKLGHVNKGKYDNYEQFLTPKVKDVVGAVYNLDFEEFGYERFT